VSGPLEEADDRLHEWSVWVRTPDGYRISWMTSTAFGRLIVPDPAPPSEAIDYERAALTDRAIAKLPGRIKFFIKVHYLDRSPTISKARRLHLGREAYVNKLTRVQIIVYRRLTPATQGVTRAQHADRPGEVSAP
jgi:hypothetical protein